MLVEGRRTRLRGHVHTFKSNHPEKGSQKYKKNVEDLLKKLRIKLKTVSNYFHS